MEKIILEKPTKKHEAQVMQLRKTFLENKETFAGCSGLEEITKYEEWIDFENRLKKKYGKDYSPSEVYLAIRKKDNKLVGIIDIRTKLTDFLYNYGGNIGYSIAIDERRKGYGKEMLKQALEKCKELKINRILITCDKTNEASAKTIKANGGKLENEIKDDVGLSETGCIQRYWITLKKRYVDKKVRGKVEKAELKFKKVKEKEFTGDIYYYNFQKVKEKIVVPKEGCVLDTGYKWLEFYDYTSRIKLTAIYNEKNQNVEWYFDIAREIGKDNEIPYEDDMYLDIVVDAKDGAIILLDEDEFEEAYQKREMTKQEYEEAYKIAKELMKKLETKKQELKKYTDKWLKIFQEN